jgi:hypothetical protein
VTSEVQVQYRGDDNKQTDGPKRKHSLLGHGRLPPTGNRLRGKSRDPGQLVTRAFKTVGQLTLAKEPGLVLHQVDGEIESAASV